MGWILGFLLLIVAVVFSYQWFIRTYGRESKYHSPPREIPGPGTFSFDIVGESHYQRALRRIAGPKDEDGKQHRCVATLVLEDENPYDKKAVRVDINGETVGHLSKSDARRYRKTIAQLGLKSRRAKVQALIVGGWSRGGGDTGHYGVKLDLSLRAESGNGI